MFYFKRYVQPLNEKLCIFCKNVKINNFPTGKAKCSVLFLLKTSYFIALGTYLLLRNVYLKTSLTVYCTFNNCWIIVQYQIMLLNYCSHSPSDRF